MASPSRDREEVATCQLRWPRTFRGLASNAAVNLSGEPRVFGLRSLLAAAGLSWSLGGQRVARYCRISVVRHDCHHRIASHESSQHSMHARRSSCWQSCPRGMACHWQINTGKVTPMLMVRFFRGLLVLAVAVLPWLALRRWRAAYQIAAVAPPALRAVALFSSLSFILHISRIPLEADN